MKAEIPASTHRQAIRALLIIFMLSFVFSCVHIPMDDNYSGPLPLSDAVKSQYAYPRNSTEYRRSTVRDHRFYTVKRIELNSTKNIIPAAGRIFMSYYAVKNKKPAPVILVLPILGGRNKVAHSFAHYFAQKGMNALIVHRHKAYKRLKDIDVVDDVLRQMVLDHMQVLDWIESRDELDASAIGVFGVSMGGIKAALVSALDRRVKASVFALAGGDIPYILSFSTEKGVRKRRNRYLNESGLPVKRFYEKLKQNITCDPLHYARHIDAANSLMVLARFDLAVPFSTGRRLREKMGSPETIYLPTGHYSSILFLPYIRYRAFLFFREKFKLSHAGFGGLIHVGSGLRYLHYHRQFSYA